MCTMHIKCKEHTFGVAGGEWRGKSEMSPTDLHRKSARSLLATCPRLGRVRPPTLPLHVIDDPGGFRQSNEYNNIIIEHRSERAERDDASRTVKDPVELAY